MREVVGARATALGSAVDANNHADSDRDRSANQQVGNDALFEFLQFWIQVFHLVLTSFPYYLPLLPTFSHAWKVDSRTNPEIGRGNDPTRDFIRRDP